MRPDIVIAFLLSKHLGDLGMSTGLPRIIGLEVLFRDVGDIGALFVLGQ